MNSKLAFCFHGGLAAYFITTSNALNIDLGIEEPERDFSTVRVPRPVEQKPYYTESDNTPRALFKSDLVWANLAWGTDDIKEEKAKDSNLDQNIQVDVVTVDLFDTDETVIKQYKDHGILVVCYINSGSIEKWRKDYKKNPESFNVLGLGKVKNWDETWLDITNLQSLKRLMKPRWQLAKEKRCDAIESDNIDCFSNDECKRYIKDKYSIDDDEVVQHQKRYIEWQLRFAHKLGLAIGMKNAVELVNDYVDQYDFAINENCFEYEECNLLKAFSDHGKAVLGTTSPVKDLGKRNQVCENAPFIRMKYQIEEGKKWHDCRRPTKK
eukprot:Pgem_evm1s16797